MRIGIIDYGMGNLRSVINACEHLGYKVGLVKGPQDLEQFSHLILPGVGAFNAGMHNLEKRDLTRTLTDHIQQTGKPLLGICLGMQLLADQGYEGGLTPGLGLIPGTVKELEVDLRIPHVGWNRVQFASDASVLSGLVSADFYFVHSYVYETKERSHIVAECEYGVNFPAIVAKGRVVGVQFHPEKSHAAGLTLIKRYFENSGAIEGAKAPC